MDSIGGWQGPRHGRIDARRAGTHLLHVSYARRLLRSRAAAGAILAAAAVTTFAITVCALVVRFEHGARLVPALGVVPAPDGTWGAAWEPLARSTDALRSEALAALVRTVLRIGLCALAVAASSLVLHAVSRILAEWRALAIRCALGARLRQLVALVGTELLVLGAMGCCVGLATGGAALALLRDAWPALLTRPERASPFVAAAAVVAVPVALLLGLVALGLLAPLQRGGVRAVSDLHGDHVTTPGPLLAVQNVLVVLQLAGLLVVTYASVLIVRDAPRAEGSAPLPYPDSLAVVPLRFEGRNAAAASARAAAAAALIRALEREGLHATVTSPDAWVGPGKELMIQSLCGACFIGSALVPFSSATVRVRAASPGALTRMSLRLRRGRDIAPRDTLGAPRVAVLSDVAAARLFPQADPVGRILRTGLRPEDAYTVVGVARSTAPGGLGAGGGALSVLYLSLLQHPPVVAEMTLRAGDASRLRRVVERLPATGGARAVLGAAVPLQMKLEESRAPLAWFGRLVAALALAATCVGTLGLAAVMSRIVTLRRRDIAVRLAVGAQPRHIEGWLLGKSLRLTMAGAIVGVSGARWVGWLLRDEVRRSATGDLAVLAVTILAFAPLGILACWLPGRRAARVQPAAVWSEPAS